MRLRDLNTSLVLLWWAQEDARNGRDIQSVITHARGRYVDRDELHPAKVRRFVRQCLRRRGLLPADRAPTPRDYERIKRHLITTWFDHDLI